jgi:hypothetical protein
MIYIAEQTEETGKKPVQTMKKTPDPSNLFQSLEVKEKFLL